MALYNFSVFWVCLKAGSPDIGENAGSIVNVIRIARRPKTINGEFASYFTSDRSVEHVYRRRHPAHRASDLAPTKVENFSIDTDIYSDLVHEVSLTACGGPDGQVENDCSY